MLKSLFQEMDAELSDSEWMLFLFLLVLLALLVLVS